LIPFWNGLKKESYKPKDLSKMNSKKYLTIIGDKGIHEKVHQKFWNDLHDKITSAFSQGQYFEGLRDAILETGLELKKFFPIDGENHNELPNEITFS
jgi:uncharacterized membrane protein